MSITIKGKKLTLDRKGKGKVSLACPAAEASGPCSGKLTVTTAKKFRLKRKGRKPVRLAGSKFSIDAGKTGKVTVKVNRAGLGLLRRSKGARKVTVVAAVRDAAGNEGTATRKLKTNKPPKGKRR